MLRAPLAKPLRGYDQPPQAVWQLEAAVSTADLTDCLVPRPGLGEGRPRRGARWVTLAE